MRTKHQMPAERFEQFSVRLPVELVAYLNREAAKNMRSRTSQVERMLYHYWILNESSIREEYEKDIRAAVDAGFKLGRAAILDLIANADKAPPRFVCFECDHGQDKPGPCAACGGSTEDVGDHIPCQ